MKKADIDFFTNGSGSFGSMLKFKESWVYKYMETLFGELVFSADRSHRFIGMDREGNFYDEIYYPTNNKNLIFTVIPKCLINKATNHSPSEIWKDVAEKGYAVYSFDTPEDISQMIWNQPYIKRIDETMVLPSYIDSFSYVDPHLCNEPAHLRELSFQINKKLDFIKEPIITTDSIKYIYREGHQGKTGPYKYHMDHLPNVLYMFFNYYSKAQHIAGRELLVASRDLSSLGLDGSSFDLERISHHVPDDSITKYNTINIKNKSVVVINSINPRFVHSVNKLKSENEVILLTNYVWTC